MLEGLLELIASFVSALLGMCFEIGYEAYSVFAADKVDKSNISPGLKILLSIAGVFIFSLIVLILIIVAVVIL